MRCTIHDSTDCGEWGGHEEEIYVIKRKKDLFISYDRKLGTCHYELTTRELPKNVKTSYDGKLTQSKKKLLESYIDEFKRHNIYRGEEQGSNAPDYYEIRLEKDSVINGYMIYDMNNAWTTTKYEILRNKLISD